MFSCVMEDNYNVLGDFENLNSVNIVKKLALLPPKKKTENALFDDLSFDRGQDELDSLFDLKETIGLGMNNKTKPNTQKSTSSKQEKSVKKNAVRNVEQECVANPTRSFISESSIEGDIPNSQPIASKKKAGKRKKTENTSAATNHSSNKQKDGEVIANTTQKKRGRKKKSDMANSTNVTTAIDIIEIEEDQISNEQPSTSQVEISSTNNEPHDVMRARRNYIAERVARCTTVDFVDLVTSPITRRRRVKDNEICTETKTATEVVANLNESFSEENPEISVKIVWNGNPEIFKLRKFQKFEHIFQCLANRAAIENDKVFLNLDSKIIVPSDTPASIDYKMFQFIYGRAMVNADFLGVSNLNKKKRDPNMLILKVQSDKWKKPLSIKLQKTEKFKNLIIKCAEELQMPYEKIKLSFDGEPLQSEQTPIDLEFEGGEVLEIYLKK